MSNNKQSSVEWLDRWFRDNPEATHEEGNVALTQAKAMHKQENLQTWLHCLTENDPITFEDYYNETFNKNEQQ